MFASEAVAGRSPLHIAAKLLGHQTIATTQGYLAVYDQGVINHRRALHRGAPCAPSEEYRQPTDTEWDEFLSHFEKRKVELAVCGRPADTLSQHGQACVRCPLLPPDPVQLPRMVEILDNLHARLAKAHDHGWLGGVDGLEVSIAGAEEKLGAMRRAPSNIGHRGRARPSGGRERSRHTGATGYAGAASGGSSGTRARPS